MRDAADSREDRFRSLYERSRPRIVAYVLRRTSSREDAADVVAETFEIAWRRLEEIPEGEAALLWLYVTARNLLANHGRRLQRREQIVTRMARELAPLTERSDPLDEQAIVMRSCLLTMPDDDREILMLAGWEGLSALQIGQVLGCSATAARIRLHRSRARLKAAMASHAASPQKRSDRVGHVGESTAKGLGVHEEALEL